MKKIDFGQIITILANIGVVAGLILLAYEIRQNTNAVGGATIQSISDQSLSATLFALDLPEFRLSWQRSARGVEYMTPEDWSIMTWYYVAILRIVENRYRQAQLGTVSEDVMGQVGGGAGGYRHPFFGVFWPRVRDQFSDDFSRWVDENLLPYVQESWEPVPPEMMLPEAIQSQRSQ